MQKILSLQKILPFLGGLLQTELSVFTLQIGAIKAFCKNDSDEYFDDSNFQRLQSERAFYAHELIAGCAAPQFGYRRYHARITEISSDIKLPLSAKLLSAVRINNLFLENYCVT